MLADHAHGPTGRSGATERISNVSHAVCKAGDEGVVAGRELWTDEMYIPTPPYGVLGNGSRASTRAASFISQYRW